MKALLLALFIVCLNFFSLQNVAFAQTQISASSAESNEDESFSSIYKGSQAIALEIINLFNAHVEGSRKAVEELNIRTLAKAHQFVRDYNERFTTDNDPSNEQKVQRQFEDLHHNYEMEMKRILAHAEAGYRLWFFTARNLIKKAIEDENLFPKDIFTALNNLSVHLEYRHLGLYAFKIDPSVAKAILQNTPVTPETVAQQSSLETLRLVPTASELSHLGSLLMASDYTVQRSLFSAPEDRSLNDPTGLLRACMNATAALSPKQD